jgi:HK97 family phage prohead protease
MANVPEAGGRSERAEWSASYVSNLPDSSFAYIEPGGSKDADGKTVPRSKRHFPIKDANGNCDAAHTRNALSRAPQSPFGARAMGKIRSCARSLGIGQESSMDPPDDGTFYREAAFTLEQTDDGRTLEGYAAVVNSPADIEDMLGTYTEVIAPGAFRQSLKPGPDGNATKFPKLMFNHGRHTFFGPYPIGTFEELREDVRGLYVRARLHDNWFVEPIADAIRSGAIDGMSIRFEVPKGKESWEKQHSKNVRTVREAKLYELGPVVYPAYAETTVAVRSALHALETQVPELHVTLGDEERHVCAECGGEERESEDDTPSEAADDGTSDGAVADYEGEESEKTPSTHRERYLKLAKLRS